MGNRKGHVQGFVQAEDGSLLKVVGANVRPVRDGVAPDATRRARAALSAADARREARRVRQSLRGLRGILAIEVES